MASSVENSILHKAPKAANSKFKPPDKTSNHINANNVNKTYTPPPRIPTPVPTPSPSALSYTSTPRAPSPTPSSLGKRPHEDGSTEKRPVPFDPKTPTGPGRHAYVHNVSSLQLEPINYNLDGYNQDQDMQDPTTNPEFFEQISDVDWSEEDRQFRRLEKVRYLTRELLNEVKAAENENCLNFIVEDEETEDAFIQLARVLPSYTSSYQLKPIHADITNLQKIVEQLTIKIDQIPKSPPAAYPDQHDKTLQGSVHAATPRTSTAQVTTATFKPQATTPNRNAHPTKPSLTTHQGPPTPKNPNSSHHPSRLVVQYSPNGVAPDKRHDPSLIVENVNAALTANPRSKHLKVVAASYNNHGNLILSTRADQTAEELLKHQEHIAPVLSKLGNNQEVTLRQDKKWYKIQIDGVNTGSLSIGNGRILHSGDTIHTELLACNPIYSNYQKTIVAKPRWLRTNEELLTTPRSSLVFAMIDEAAARLILNQKTLAAFGRHCSIRAYQDRPPVIQCRNCWSLEHNSHQCRELQRCRLCSGLHDEANHPKADPANCHRCTLAHEMGDSMDTTSEGQCPHDIRCPNCLGDSNKEHDHPADARRCPTRLEKYGTARENERRAQKSDNPWTKVKPRKPKTKTATTGSTSASITTSSLNQNRFDPLSQMNANDTAIIQMAPPTTEMPSYNTRPSK